MWKLSLIIVLAVSQFVTVTYSHKRRVRTVEVYSQKWYTGAEVKVNLTEGCYPKLPSTFNGLVASLKTSGNCVNLYRNEGCDGYFVRMQPGHYESLYALTPHFSFSANASQDRFETLGGITAQSIGPCLHKCDARNWLEAKRNQTVVWLFDDPFDIGEANKTKIVIPDANSCIPIPTQTQIDFSSVEIEGGTEACVELHYEPHCGTDSVMLRPGFPFASKLLKWGMDSEHGNSEDRHSAVHATALSLCGYQCNRTIAHIKEQDDKAKEDTENLVTLYDGRGYHGNALHMNITAESGCVNVTGEMAKKATSIRTYGKCIVAYERVGCPEQPLSLYYQTDYKSFAYYKNKLLTATYPTRIKSLRLCESYEESNKIRHRDEPEPKIADDECPSCTCNRLVDNSSSSFWLILLYIVLLIIYTSIAALLGAFAARQYEKWNYKVTSDKFNILYNNENGNSRGGSGNHVQDPYSEIES